MTYLENSIKHIHEFLIEKKILQSDIDDFSKQPVIAFGLSKNRVDILIRNLFLLLKNPGCLFFETSDELIFAIDSKMGTVDVNLENYKHISFASPYGKATDLTYSPLEGSESTVKSLAGEFFTETIKAKSYNLKVGTGSCIVSLTKEAPLNTLVNKFQNLEIPSLSTLSMISIFQILLYQSSVQKTICSRP